jgi:hypothetical protein
MGDGDSQRKTESDQAINGKRRPGTGFKVKEKWTASSMIGEQKILTSGAAPYSTLAAGAGCGLVASIATCPLDVVKTKLQAQRAVHGQQGYLGVFGKSCIFVIFLTSQVGGHI